MEASGDRNAGLVAVPAKTFAAKYATKREIYGLLTQKADMYIDDVANVTIYHLKDLACGRKSRKCLFVS